jgi:hypothetical protein
MRVVMQGAEKEEGRDDVKSAKEASGGDLDGGHDSSQIQDTCIVYCLCSALGLITGFHWVYMWCRWRKRLPGAARSALGHAVFYWVVQVLFWIVRQSMLPWYIKCKGGESNSVPCLFKEQEGRYTAFYAIHILLLAFQLFHW